jgi:hypothetical protein
MATYVPAPSARSAGEEGFTALEVMIAVLLTSLAVGLAYGAYGFLSRVTARWKDRMALENAAHLGLRDLTRRAYRAAEIRRADDSWTFVAPGGTETTYRLQGDTLFRNGSAMHGGRIGVVGLQVEESRPSPPARPFSTGQSEAFGQSSGLDGDAGAFSGEFSASGPQASGARRYLRLRLTMATEADTLSLRTVVYLRQPEGWSSPSDNGQAPAGESFWSSSPPN